ncbi:MAG: hypothetical protein CFE37_02175 [Alphaproteobacteria bacterium PA4]|nr:MAG: hypothetical protein CFE37_02175 [Alphaproteobacteria bacterium PA4]
MLASTAAIMLAGAASPAAATVTASLLQNTASTSLPGVTFDLGQDLIDVSHQIGSTNGVTVEALSRLTSSEILFRNSVIAAGQSTTASATIGVEINVTNTYGKAFRPVLQTKLLAAGLGMFVTATEDERFYNQKIYNPTETVTYEQTGPSNLACGSGRLKNCGLLSDSDLNAINQPLLRPSVFGSSSVGFIFDVTVGGVEAYRLTSTLNSFSDGSFTQEFSREYGAADTVLNNFRLSSAPGATMSRGYMWDDTFVNIAFPDILDVGESVTAVYSITTFATIGSDAGDLNWTQYKDFDGGFTAPFLNRAGTAVGYAAFADPIGGGSTIDNINSARTFNLGAAGLLPTGGINTNGTGVFDIGNIGVDPDTGGVTLAATTTAPPADVEPYGPFNPVPTVAGVPEPSAWSLLIIGFGFIGQTLRRRRTVIA